MTEPPDPFQGQQPPQDVQAEQAVLGGMLLSREIITAVRQIVTRDDFYRPAHQMVWDAIAALDARGEPLRPPSPSPPS